MGHSRDGLDGLIQAIYTTPIIDNHAHPLLKPAALLTKPLLAIATEAHGAAIDASRTGLAHLRAVAHLSRVLGCDATWDAVVAAVGERREAGRSHEAWVARCLDGIECVLVDDGLDDLSEAEAYNYFDDFTPGASKRIVRIEQFLPGLIDEACVKHDSAPKALRAVLEGFIAVIEGAIRDPEVVGFKSVICYRTGLAIPRDLDDEMAKTVFKRIFEQRRRPDGTAFTRLNHRGLNEYFVHLLASLIRDSEDGRKKPIQFHTGLGDNDITLTKASPGHLQEFIRAYPSVPIVLLHSGWPFAREVGYLAAMYDNVYADIGEVFPFLSRDGQEGVVRQILELCPGSKVLWSTDGHWFPETYLLAVDQMREVLATVLSGCVRKRDLTVRQATQFVEDVLFNNSNKLYDLGLTLKKRAVDVRTPLSQGSKNLQILSKFLEDKEAPRFLRVVWNDMTATSRMRAIPMRRVWSMLRNGDAFSFGVTKASLGLLRHDVAAPGVSPSGEHDLHPDLSTLRLGPREGHITVMGDFKEKDGSAVALCPRTTLKKALDVAASQQGLEFTLGFEIELLLVRRVAGEAKYEALGGDGHAWSTSSAMDHDAAISVIEEAIEKLDAAGVYVEMVHAESADGQYEIILPRAPALHAVDTLLYAREVISSCATAAGYRMTLHPKPFAMACGTASHMHMSVTSTATGSEPAATVHEALYAGILQHLRAICAFTYSSAASYERVQDGCWAGGTWVAWGTQNRETPLRRIQGSHWELKALDGLANPYLAVAAVVLAGVDGVARGAQLGRWQDCGDADPAGLGEDGRRAKGVVEKLPGSVGEALASLEEDEVLCGLLGEELVKRYVVVKRAEDEMLQGMGGEERRRWIMERY